MEIQTLTHGKFYYIRVRGAETVEVKAQYQTGGYFKTLEDMWSFSDVDSFREA